MSSQAIQPSLYERLGGIYSIATVVDDFIDRVMTDPRLNANPAVNEAHHKVPPAGFKYLVTEMVGWATGGPQRYTGRPMRESHQHLNITPREALIKSHGICCRLFARFSRRERSGNIRSDLARASKAEKRANSRQPGG